MSMLKSLKNKKEGKADPKKDNKKDKQSKKEPKKVDNEEEDDTVDPLVDMNQFVSSKDDNKASKKINKIQNSKLQEKEIDTSNIIVEKKQEKKVLSSWVVDEKNIDKEFAVKFDMNKVDTDFISLTDENKNKELEEKRKREAEENKNKVEEIGGVKYAPLQKSNNTYVDVNTMNIKKSTGENVALNPQIQVTSSALPQFTNSNTGSFVPLEKTPQQLKEEEYERKMKLQASTPATTATKNTWLGKKSEPQPVAQEFKVSGWAQKANEASSAPVKFAPLEKGTNSQKFNRVEQELVFVSKKEQEERRKKREEAAEKEKAEKV